MKQSNWNKHLMSVYRELKAKNSKIRLRDAMVVAKGRYKK